MIGDIRKFLAERPFTPFAVLSSGGHRYEVPTSDHASIDPKGTRLVIWFDDESSIILSGLHIVGLERQQKAEASLP